MQSALSLALLFQTQSADRAASLLGLSPIRLVIGLLGVGFSILDTFYLRAYAAITEYTFLAMPLFIFMAIMVERSGISEKVFSTLFILMGGLRGSLAIVTVITGTLLAATMGIFSPSVVMLGLAALPPMMARGYQKEMACGAICSAGSLGIFIRPSIMFILYGPMSGLSVGKMFIAAIPSEPTHQVTPMEWGALSPRLTIENSAFGGHGCGPMGPQARSRGTLGAIRSRP